VSALSGQPEAAEIVDTLVDGRGVAKTAGKAVFVHGALKGEQVEFVRRKKRRNYDEAELTAILQAAPGRVEPDCEYFGVCGGCSLQHLAPSQQLELKQAVLLENLQRIGAARPERVLDPIASEVWGYRRKARLAVKYVTRKGRVLVGYRERNKPYVADMQSCKTLHPKIGERIPELIEMIGGLSIRDRLPQIEAAVGDNGVAMIFRVMSPPSADDMERFSAFRDASGVFVYLQEKGPDTITPLPGDPQPDELYYTLPDFDVELQFTALDFLQVHGEVNRRMIGQAIDLLQPDRETRVLDLFCGLGNFSLPIATRAREVVGMELTGETVNRARANATRSGLANVFFHVADLNSPAPSSDSLWKGFDLVMLDPPRTGALELMDVIGTIGAKRVLYVSCHPGTLARDAKHLVHELGYDLEAAGVMDMFPHTSHVESMALFRK
jgi:23S rRNA (uracil1939-C5)-methyltransferase